MGTSEEIKAEIVEKFGFFPPFFSPALANPHVLENLWQQTLSAYVNNPLSPLFKEKLSAYLSRYCGVPYCMICHSCSLSSLGMKSREVLEFLESPAAKPHEIDKHFNVLIAHSDELMLLPEQNSPLEESLLYCSIYVSLEGEEAEYYRAELRRLLGVVNYQHIITFVAYVKTCHAWMEAHPEVAYEADKRTIDYLAPLLEDEPALADFFRNYVEKVKEERQSWKERICDITARKQAKEALRQSEQRFRFVTEAIPQQVWTARADGALDYFNQRVLDYFERTLDEMIGWGWQSVLHPDDLPGCIERWSHSLSTGELYEIEFRLLCAQSGTYRWHIGRALPMYDEEGRVVSWFGTNTDIDDRKQAQEELQRQHNKAQLFAEISLKIRQSLQIEEILQTTVKEVQRILQADRVLIYRLRPDGTGSSVAEAVVPGWQSVLGHIFSAEVFPQEYHQLYSRGRIRAIEDVETSQITPCMVEFSRQFDIKAKLIVPIILNQKLWGLLIAHQCATARQWSNFEIELLDQLANQIGIALDQGQLLEQETRQRQELIRSNEELQQFAYIASHDLQEPLRKIQAFGDRLKNKYSEVLNEQGRDYIERMQGAAARMQFLIDDLLTLSRVTRKVQSFTLVNLAQVAKEVVSDLEVRIQQTGGRVEIGELPSIHAEPLQMRQLLQNLIGNALKFHRAAQTPVVKVYSISPATDLYQIFVEDNGIGLEEKYLDRIFNVFQRLHSRSEYEGTGMGLAICRKIVEHHGGSITAKSVLGQGATFIITLPIKQTKGDNI